MGKKKEKEEEIFRSTYVSRVLASSLPFNGIREPLSFRSCEQSKKNALTEVKQLSGTWIFFFNDIQASTLECSLTQQETKL
jgi:hypothetical protein